MLQKLYPESRIGHPAPCLWVPVPTQTEDRETKRPRDPYDALRIEHPTPSRGGGAGGRGKHKHAPIMSIAPGNRLYTAFPVRLMFVFPAICPREAETRLFYKDKLEFISLK